MQQSKALVVKVTMNKILFFVIILLASVSSKANEEILLAYAYNFPLLICYNDEYRACYKDIELELCAIELKKYRESCLQKVSDPASPNAVAGLAACMVASHAGADSFENISDPCIKVKGMNINISQNTKKIKEADPKWVENILE
ncbi:MAG: hypothetical protein K6L81_12975 [Agarilytica sp.]